jgi:hypothetical protein
MSYTQDQGREKRHALHAQSSDPPDSPIRSVILQFRMVLIVGRDRGKSSTVNVSRFHENLESINDFLGLYIKEEPGQHSRHVYAQR